MTSGTIHEDPHELEGAHGSAPTEQVRIVGAERAGDAGARTSPEADADAEDAGADRGRDGDPREGWNPEDHAPPAEPQLPHWTEAPTGEIPAVLSRGGPEEGDPWASLPEPTWREEQRDWEQEEALGTSLLAGGGDERSLLSETDEEERQPWSFDIGAPAGGHPPGEDDTDELDHLGAGPLFGASVAGRANQDDTDQPDETVGAAGRETWDSEDAADELTSELRQPGLAEPTAEHIVGARGARAAVDDRDGSEDDVEGDGDGSVAVPASRDRSRTRGASWLHVHGRRGEHADAAAVAADAVSVATDVTAAWSVSATRREAGAARSALGAHRPAPDPPRVPRHAEDALSQRAGRDVPAAIVSGIVVGGLALLAFHFGSVPSMVVVTVVLSAAAVEAYAAFRPSYRPATLLGIAAVVGVIVGSYDDPFAALPVVAVLLVAATVSWHLLGVDRRAEPVRSTAATLFVFCWVGVFGSFAALLLAPSLFPGRTGIAYLLGALIAAVAYDVGALVVGAWVGRHPLSTVSPGKTWEGVIGGALAAIIFSIVIVHLIHPWTLGEAAALGVVVAVVSPLGDLCESLVKRQLGLKDMGRILPGHGGLLDRVDGLLFVLPAAYYLVRAFGHG